MLLCSIHLLALHTVGRELRFLALLERVGRLVVVRVELFEVEGLVPFVGVIARIQLVVDEVLEGLSNVWPFLLL